MKKMSRCKIIILKKQKILEESKKDQNPETEDNYGVFYYHCEEYEQALKYFEIVKEIDREIQDNMVSYW